MVILRVLTGRALTPSVTTGAGVSAMFVHRTEASQMSESGGGYMSGRDTEATDRTRIHLGNLSKSSVAPSKLEEPVFAANVETA